MNLHQQTLIIRLSQMKDAQALMDIDALVWTERTAPEPLYWPSREDFLKHCPPASQLVAECDGVVCGYIGFRHPTGLAGNGHVYEIDIAVHPAYQREGIGARLIEETKIWAANQGKLKLRLRVLSINTSAIAFYRKCGFVEEGRLIREFWIEDRYVDAIWMACFLDK
ncbi:GNAT family N-acetyltransferase [Paenibacillus sp.]|jgi:RimJ/RimL family protein N-acetyltransferase|uniref:GNAT family N-acetyltransferase n=1 Tax=Paenibacillus sp. TaxID=58172 RepID=UPI0028171CB3|nr:GNAT family N-acetyltransferase [Paenibacillus sp.]MDR0269299.1 GNAT family N-acetyltransferase [Paenibacillus sp.]